MTLDLQPPQALDIWRRALVETARREQPDLSARQLALMLTVYLTAPPHTVRGLAATVNVSKHEITRALHRLRDQRLIYRKPHATEKRQVEVQWPVQGSVCVADFAD